MALALVSSGLLHLFPSWVRFLVVLGVFTFLPGELLLRHGFPWRSIETRLALGFLVGASLFAMVTWICWMSGVSFRVYLALVQGVAAGFFGLSLAFSVWERRRSTASTAEPRKGGGTGSGIIFVAIALCISVFFGLFPPEITYRGDAFTHIGAIQRIISENTFTPGDPLAPPIFAEGETPKADPRLGAFHPLFAAIAVLANLEPVELWRWVPVAAAPVAFLSFVGFATTLLPGGGYVALALVLFLMFQGGIGRLFFGTIGYGQHMSLAFMWMFVVVSLRHAAETRVRWLVLLGLVVLGGSLVHIDVVIHCALAWCAFLLFYKTFGFSLRGVISMGVVTALCAGAPFFWRMTTSYGEGNILHAHAQGLLYFVDIGDRFFVPSPAEIIRRNGLLFFVGLFLVPLLPFLKSRRRYAMMSFALSVPVILTALNPLVCPILYGKGHYLVHRFVLNIPSFVVTPLVIGCAISWGRTGRPWRKVLAAAALFLWARVFLIGAGEWARDLRSVRDGRDKPVLSSEVSRVVAFINERTPAKSVVLTDPVTSFVLHAFSHARVVAVLGQHGNPNDRYPLERLAAIHEAMSPYTPQIAAVNAIRRFKADYVLVNGAFGGPCHDFLADWDPRFMEVLAGKLGTLTEVFKRVYRTDEIVVYKIEQTSFERMTWEPAVPFLEGPGLEMEHCESPGRGGEARVAAMRIDPGEALPGEKVRVGVAYRKLDGTEPTLPLKLRLRFEDRESFEGIRSYPGDKIVRRFLERRERAFRRFRVDREPFEGYFLLRDWPDDAECYEQFDVSLPTSLCETAYEVQWQLVEDTLLPNFSIRDFLFNQDSYVGTPCTEIEVRRAVVR